MDTLELASAIPEAGDEAFQIHRLKRSAYAAVLRAFYAQPDLLSGVLISWILPLFVQVQLQNISKQIIHNISKQVQLYKFYAQPDFLCFITHLAFCIFFNDCFVTMNYLELHSLISESNLSRFT